MKKSHRKDNKKPAVNSLFALSVRFRATDQEAVWYWPADSADSQILVTRSKAYARYESEDLPDILLMWRGNAKYPSRPPGLNGKTHLEVVADIVFVPNSVKDLKAFSEGADFLRRAGSAMSAQIVLVSGAEETECFRPSGGVWKTSTRVFLATVPHPVLVESAEYVNNAVEWDYPASKVQIAPDGGDDPLPEARSGPTPDLNNTEAAISSLPFMVGAFKGSSTRRGWYDFPHSNLLEKFIAEHGEQMVTTIADVKNTVTRLSKWCPLTMLPYHPVWKQFTTGGKSLQIVHITPYLKVDVHDVTEKDLLSGELDSKLFPFMLADKRGSSEWGIVFVACKPVVGRQKRLKLIKQCFDAGYIAQCVSTSKNYMIPWFVGTSVFPYAPHSAALPSLPSRGEILDRILFRAHSGSSSTISVNFWVNFVRVLTLSAEYAAMLHWTVVAPVFPSNDATRVWFKPVWSFQTSGRLFEHERRVGVWSNYEDDLTTGFWTFEDRSDWLKTLITNLGCLPDMDSRELSRAATYLPQIVTNMFRPPTNQDKVDIQQCVLLCRSTPDFVIGVQESADVGRSPKILAGHPAYLPVQRWNNTDHMPNDDDDDGTISIETVSREVARYCTLLTTKVHNRMVTWQVGSFSVRSRIADSEFSELEDLHKLVFYVCNLVCNPYITSISGYFNFEFLEFDLLEPQEKAYFHRTVVMADSSIRLAPGVNSLSSSSYPVVTFAFGFSNPENADTEGIIDETTEPNLFVEQITKWIVFPSIPQTPTMLRMWLGETMYFTLHYLHFPGSAAEDAGGGTVKVYLDNLFLTPSHFEAGLTGSVMVQLVQNFAVAARTGILGLQDASCFENTSYGSPQILPVETNLGYYLRGNDAPTSFYETLGFVPCLEYDIYDSLDDATYVTAEPAGNKETELFYFELAYSVDRETLPRDFLLRRRLYNKTLADVRKSLSPRLAPDASAPDEYGSWVQFVESFLNMQTVNRADVRERCQQEIKLGRFDTMEFVDWCIKNGLRAPLQPIDGIAKRLMTSASYMYMTGVNLRNVVRSRVKKAKVGMRAREELAENASSSKKRPPLS